MNVLSRAIKRSIDIIGASTTLVVATPIMIPIAVAIRVTMGKPVLFSQPRSGLNGEPFIFTKFRTMRPIRPGEHHVNSDGDRITPLGDFLRKTSLDELPTLFNVLKGDMSLVGPRPFIVLYLTRMTAEQARRVLVKPGVTGLAIVMGRSNLSYDEKFKYDLYYVDNQSLLLDAKILIKTVWSILSREGATAEGYATGPEFMGTLEQSE